MDQSDITTRRFHTMRRVNCRRVVFVIWAMLLMTCDAWAEWRLGVMLYDPDPNPLAHGVKITAVTPGDPAQSHGLEAGDMIYAIDGRWVHTVAEVHHSVVKSSGAIVLKIRDWRTGAVLDLRVPLRWTLKFPALRPARRTALNRMSPLERLRLRDAMLAYINDAVIAQHVQMHTRMQNDPTMTPRMRGDMLLTFHRGFIAGMETSLAQQGLPLPMWIPGTPIPEEMNIAEVPGFPGQTAFLFPPGRPPVTPVLPLEFRGVNLRNFPDRASLGMAIRPFHDAVHGAIGMQGTPRNAMGDFTSPAAPIFWCWHAFVDQIYADWEYAH